MFGGGKWSFGPICYSILAMMKFFAAFLTIFLAMLAMPAAAQDAAEDDPEIIVPGTLPERGELRDAVRAVSRERRSDVPLLRYLDPICLRVTGMHPRANTMVRERILANIREADVAVNEGDCPANAVVIVAAEPAEVIDLLNNSEPSLITSQNRNAIEASLAAQEPVLVWHNAADRSAQGGRLALSQTIPGVGGTASPLNVSVRVNSSSSARRVGATHSRAVVSGVVVLDIDWLVGMDLERVGDFATMRLLAPGIEPRGHTFDAPTSVMWPFEAERGETELTRFDRAYLRALYGLRPNAGANVLTSAVLREYERE